VISAVVLDESCSTAGARVIYMYNSRLGSSYPE
jgi:hypothetical protein